MSDHSSQTVKMVGRSPQNGTAFIVYGIPQPKGSTRAFVKNGRTITTSANPRLKDWHNLVAMAAQEYRPKDGLITGTVGLSLKFHFVRPKSVSKKKRPYHTVKPDIDKLTRAVLDALTGIFYADDAQVDELVVEKGYSDSPRVEIWVWGAK